MGLGNSFELSTSLSLSNSQTHSNSHTPCLSLTHIFSITLTHTHLWLSLSLYLPLILSVSPSIFLCLFLCFTHTHTLSLSLSLFLVQCVCVLVVAAVHARLVASLAETARDVDDDMSHALVQLRVITKKKCIKRNKIISLSEKYKNDQDIIDMILHQDAQTKTRQIQRKNNKLKEYYKNN